MKKTILCVDDEKVVLDALREQLKNTFGNSFNYEVAESVEEAWEVIDDLVANDCNIVIIVSDWLMPGTRGDKFLVEVFKKYPEVVTIMLTGHADAEAIENAKVNANLYAYVPKPWNQEKLMSHMKSALEKLGISL